MIGVLKKPGNYGYEVIELNNFQIKSFVLSEHAKGKSIILIDTENEYKQLCESLNGAYITSKSELNDVESNFVVINK
ncbi:hypothetical protein [Bacillus thuringiensis]|uniref:hypothetical protein n=1 Tax=Bacillus thuringiensis TaxID=1428 RepID=UPI0021D6534D|nr:hypothetical protein [Bacillus thuringiensis]MCU7667502.1 hypothetical protein [Bacillus thuringiensis]